jgi:hypothetical protein
MGLINRRWRAARTPRLRLLLDNEPQAADGKQTGE